MATTSCGRGRMSTRAAIAKHASKARQGKSKFIVELPPGNWRGNPLFETTLNFPPVDSMLSDGCKYTVLRSQMHRFDRNCTYAADFIANTAALAVRMVRNRYNERRVIDEIHKYRSWDLSKGDWRRVEGRVVRRVTQALHPHTRHTHTHRAQPGPTR